MGLFKRLGSLTLALCISLTAVFSVFAEDVAPEKEYVDMASEKAIILKALDIISDGQYEKTAEVTRSEFANALSMTANNTAPQGKMEYDLDGDDGGMYWLINNDIMHGNGQGVFSPDEKITVAEAVKLSLSILGYAEYAEVNGGYPFGYITLAKRNNILDGVSKDSEDLLTYDEFISILYNVIKCDIMDIVLVSNNGYREYDVVEGATLLSVYRNIYRGEGIVEADEVSGLYSENEKTERGRIRVNGKEFEAPSLYTTANELLGMNVIYYYFEEEESSRELICAVPYNNEILEMSSDDIISYNSGKYTYQTEGSHSKTAEIEGNTIILYNGAHAADNTVFVPETGKVVLISNDRDKKYNVLKVVDSKTVIAERAVQTNGNYTIFDKFDTQYNVVISDYINSSLRAYNTDGQEIKPDRIANGNVIEVVKTSGIEPYYKITVVTKSISDLITSADSEYKRLTTASERKYDTTPRFRKLIADGDIELSYNTACTIHLTSDGRVAYIDYNTSAASPLTYRTGYLHKFGYENEKFKTIPRARVLDESGEWKTYLFAKRVKTDSVIVKAEKLDLSSNTGKVCRYMLNIQGEISEIYFPASLPQDPAATDMDDKFQTIYTGAGRYKYYAGGFAIGNAERILRVAATMKVFIKAEPEEGGELTEDYIVATGYDALTDGANYQFEIYSYSQNPGIADVALIKTGNSQIPLDRRQGRPMVISEVLSTMTEEGDFVHAVTGFRNGASATVYIDDQRSDNSVFPFKSGDVAYLLPDINGIVTLRDDYVTSGGSKGYSYGLLCGFDDNGVLQTYNTSTGGIVQGTWGIYLGDNNTARADRTLLGKAYDVTDTHIYVSTGDNAADWSRVEPFNLATGPVYIYDEHTETFGMGNAAEAICAKYDAADASDVYVVAANGYQVIVIYP